jgi:hypothetical protein
VCLYEVEAIIFGGAVCDCGEAESLNMGIDGELSPKGGDISTS